MHHGVHAQLAERERLHLAVGRVVLDPVAIAPETVARVEQRRIAVGDGRELVEASAGEDPEPLQRRLEMAEQLFAQVERE